MSVFSMLTYEQTQAIDALLEAAWRVAEPNEKLGWDNEGRCNFGCRRISSGVHAMNCPLWLLFAAVVAVDEAFPDHLDRSIATRTEENPDYPARVQAALDRRRADKDR